MQFTLQTLLLSFVVVASALAAFEGWGLLVAAVILAVVAYIRSSESPGRAAIQAACVCLIVLFPLCCAGLIAKMLARDSYRELRCGNRLRDIADALQMYHDTHGHFPPAYVLGPDGKPWHSWRTLILREMGCHEVYQMYRFNEPWNGPNNRKLASMDVECFVCPLDAGHQAGQTNYLAVVSPATLWPGATPASLDDCRSRVGPAILLIEAPGSGIVWSEPRDVTLAEACDDGDANGMLSKASHPRKGDFFFHPGACALVAAADGQVYCVDATMPAETRRALLTGTGVDELDPNWLRVRQKLNWPHIGGLICLVLSTLLLLCRPIRRGNTSFYPGEEPK